jgi:hypothetical protein
MTAHGHPTRPWATATAASSATDGPLSKLDVTGGNPADGIVKLRFDTAVVFPPGQVIPVGPTKTMSRGSHPVLPAYASTGVFPLGPFPCCLCGID